MKDEGRHNAVVSKCMQACLGLLDQLVSFPKEDGAVEGNKRSKYSVAEFQACCNLSFPAMGLEEGVVSCAG